ncbi:MAG TPA: hypothetical protein EYG89_00550 [Bacteroidia bacterium]|nr:hypothetical protein [Bacteroidia bacterium]
MQLFNQIKMNKIPITIGIVGHIDAIITKEHRLAFKSAFNMLSEQYLNSPITLFSQLAVGADTEVAKLFLEVKETTKTDYRLITPIPYDLDYYKKTQFKTENELNTFNNLFKQSERSFVLNKLSDNVKRKLDKDIDENFDELNEYYRKGGEFVADSSIVLIVLWDEKDNKLQGGSANVVTYKKTGSYQRFISEHIFDSQGSLISIPCNRKGNSKPIVLKDDYLVILLKDLSIKKALDKIEELNVSHSKIEPLSVEKSANYLFPEENRLSASNETLKSFYALIDSQANKHQIKYNRILKGLFILGFIIFGVFEAYKHLGLHQALFFSTLALLAFAFGVFKISFKWKNHKKYIENRVLAESLRIQFFWNLSNIKKSVSKYILRIHKKEYDWLKHILLSIYGLTYPNENSNKESISVVKKYWIDNQKEYFIKKVKELERKEKQNKIISSITFGIGLILLIGVFVLNLKYEHHKWLHPLIVLDSIVFGVFALIKAYYEKRGHDQTKTQYSLMASIYKASSNKINEIDLLNKENESEEIDNILFLTGKEAVVENGNWYMIYKDKEPEIEGIG